MAFVEKGGELVSILLTEGALTNQASRDEFQIWDLSVDSLPKHAPKSRKGKSGETMTNMQMGSRGKLHVTRPRNITKRVDRSDSRANGEVLDR